MALAFILTAAAGLSAIPLVVTGGTFESELSGDDGAVVKTVTTAIPYIPGRSCYRWTIRVKPRRGIAAVSERFTLPAEPEVWGGVENSTESGTKLSSSRRIAVTDLIVPTKTGRFDHSWCVAQGDPEGPHRIDVFQGKRLLRRFDFRIGSPSGDR